MLIRPMIPDDIAECCGLLNHTIALGGTTAYETPFSAETFAADFMSTDDIANALVAENMGAIVGFQVLFWNNKPDATQLSIASFADQRAVLPGVGYALMQKTKQDAVALGCEVIVAKIRADNALGLRFYRRQGFREVDRLRNVPLSDGTPVDRVITKCWLNEKI